MTIADLDRVIQAVAATLDRVPYEGETAEAESFVVVTKLPYGDVLRAREALTLLRQMRERAVEGWVGTHKDRGLTPAEALDLDGEIRLWVSKGHATDRPALLILTPEEPPC